MPQSKRILLLVPIVLWGCSTSNSGSPPVDASAGDALGDSAMQTGDAIALDAGVADGAADAGDAAMTNDGGDAGDAVAMNDSGDAAPSSDGGDGGDAGDSGLLAGQRLPTGDFITPTAAPGSALTTFNPGMVGAPNFLADHAASSVTSPDGKTLLVLTSGYNETNYTPAENQADEGYEIPSESGEWVFVYDISGNRAPVQKQILSLPNSFAGIAFNPSGAEFYVAGGQDDNVHVFDRVGAVWAERSVTTDAGTAPAPIALGHQSALGLANYPQSAGVAVTRDGSKLVVANYENDSISIVDLGTQTVTAELDLRPGKAATSPATGVAGGEFPFWIVIKGNDTAYVSSQRDREVDVVTLAAPDGGAVAPAVTRRIAVGGQPNKMILNRDQTRLFVANGNSDTVTVVDTTSDTVIETVSVLAPPNVLANAQGLKGANPNGLALSSDEKTLYVTDGATNAVAVVARDPRSRTGAQTIGLIPTGWYPTSVSTSADGSYLYVTNAKSVPGAACLDILDASWGPVGTLDGGPTEGGGPTPDQHCWNGNQYVWQLETAGLMSTPTPSASTLGALTE